MDDNAALAMEVKPNGLVWAQASIALSGCRGPGPIGMITWKHELLVVPFAGQWAAGPSAK